MSHRTPAAAALVTLFFTGCASQPSEDPTAYSGDVLYNCPMGNADADGNRYPDACDQLLWSDAAQPRTYSAQPSSGWDPKSRAEIVLYMTPAFIAGAGADAGGYDSNTGAFEDVDDAADFPTSLASNPNLQRGADWIQSSTLAQSFWLQPRVGDENLDGVSVPLDGLKGKHVSHFVRTITGYGYDASTNTVAFRGSWQIFGY